MLWKTVARTTSLEPGSRFLPLILTSVMACAATVSAQTNVASGRTKAVRWVTLYAGGPTNLTPLYPAYTVPELVRYISFVDTAGRPTAWLTSGAIFLNLFSGAHHLFATWMPMATRHADGADWEAYIDSLVSPGGPTARLDSAIAQVATILGPPRARFRIAVMIPYPDPTGDSLRFLGTTYRLGDPQDRANLAVAYSREFVARYGKTRFPNLQLDGLYWLKEDVPPQDSTVLPRVAAAVRKLGVRFIWVPSYHRAASAWKRWGFDEAWLQPNYFFDPKLAVGRLDSAVVQARAADMGMEIEFNRKLLTDSVFARRLDPYLATLTGAADLQSRSVVMFDGAGGLLDLSGSKDPRYVVLYKKLAEVLRQP